MEEYTSYLREEFNDNAIIRDPLEACPLCNGRGTHSLNSLSRREWCACMSFSSKYTEERILRIMQSSLERRLEDKKPVKAKMKINTAKPVEQKPEPPVQEEQIFKPLEAKSEEEKPKPFFALPVPEKKNPIVTVQKLF
jgi:hypothetical protein